MNTNEYNRSWRARNPEKAKEYSRRWYKKNKESVKARTSANREKHKRQYLAQQRSRVAKIRTGIRWYKQTNGCMDCGITDWRVLEFDHIPERGAKLFNIGGTTWNALPTLWKEIQKCDVVCANCHAIRTRERGQWVNGI